MDDRLAKRLYEDNFLDRLQKAQDDISLLQKLSVNAIYEAIYDLVNGLFTRSDGWIPTSWASPTRVSDTVFTVAEDVTGLIELGTKLKLTDTTVKFLVVKSAVFGSGVTTITTFATTDFALVGNPSAIYYSNIEKPFGWVDWFNYTGTPTASGSMTVTAHSLDLAMFRVSGKTMQFKYRVSGITLGGTASTSVIFPAPSLPVYAGAFVLTIIDTTTLGGRGAFSTSVGFNNFRPDGANWTLGTNRLIQADGAYPIE